MLNAIGGQLGLCAVYWLTDHSNGRTGFNHKVTFPGTALIRPDRVRLCYTVEQYITPSRLNTSERSGLQSACKQGVGRCVSQI